VVIKRTSQLLNPHGLTKCGRSSTSWRWLFLCTTLVLGETLCWVVFARELA